MSYPQGPGEIFKRYKDRVYRLALSISRNEKDAEDIVQNTFLKIIDNLRYFRKEAEISTWIYRITYNEALMHLRRKGRQFKLSRYIKGNLQRMTSDMFVNWEKLPDQQLLDKEFKERLGIAIKDMPIKYRMPLLLHNTEGLSVKDSARVLGIRPNSLKTRLHRSYLLVRDEIAAYLKDRGEFDNREDRRCGPWVDFVYSYATKTLDNKKKSVFNRHIQDCPSCKAFLKTYTKAIRITKALECKDIPEELKASIEVSLKRK